MNIELVPFASPLYAQMVAFRDELLRRALGLEQSAADLDGEESQFHIALLENGVVLGTVVLKPIGRGVVKLRQMAVAPQLRGRGLGRNLVVFAEHWALAHDFLAVELHARATARRFYESLGYQAIGPEFIEVTVSHVAMRRELVPVETDGRTTREQGVTASAAR